MLGSLAAHERRARLAAAPRNARDDVSDALRNHLAARDVVGHEEGLRAHHDDVVDHHADEIDADRVVLVDRLRDRNLGADTIGAGGKERMLVAQQSTRVEKTSEAANATDNLRPMGSANCRLHEFDSKITRCGIDAGFRIGILGDSSHASSLPALSGRRRHVSLRLRRSGRIGARGAIRSGRRCVGRYFLVFGLVVGNVLVLGRVGAHATAHNAVEQEGEQARKQRPDRAEQQRPEAKHGTKRVGECRPGDLLGGGLREGCREQRDNHSNDCTDEKEASVSR